MVSPLSAGFGRIMPVQQPNDPEWGFFWLKRHGVVGVLAFGSSSNFAGGNEHLVDSWGTCSNYLGHRFRFGFLTYDPLQSGVDNFIQ